MTSRPIFRNREERFDDARSDQMLKVALKSSATAKSTEGLLAQLVGKTHLSNLIAIAGNDMFTLEERQAAVDVIRDSVFITNLTGRK